LIASGNTVKLTQPTGKGFYERSHGKNPTVIAEGIH
jgi:hypothetical protein